jgi:large subunit ribosomal protein L21e
MAKRIGGARRKTRHKLVRNAKDKGKITTSTFFQNLEAGDTVVLHPNPAVQKGIFSFRYVGRHAVVMGRTGDCYEVLMRDGGKEKKLIVHPVHLKKIVK